MMFAGVVLLAIIVVVTLFLGRNRLTRSGPVPEGFEKTNEVFVDSTTGVKQRVWYNPTTGERHYEIIDDPRR